MTRRLLFGLLAFLSVGVALAAPLPWLLGVMEPFDGMPPLLAHLIEEHDARTLVFVAHVSGGGLALLLAPWQLVPRIRARVRLHRAIGMVYVGAVAVGGCAGLVMGPMAWGGPVARAGFTALAIGWLATTAFGLHRILAGDVPGHRQWILRSVALTLAAVSLRVQVPVMSVLGVPDALAYATIAWTCWVPNLVIIELARLRRDARTNLAST